MPITIQYKAWNIKVTGSEIPRNINDKIKLTVEFDIAGVLTDPATVTFMVREPDKTETSYVYGVAVGLLKESTGIYYMYVTFDAIDLWYFRAKCTGDVNGSEEARFKVASSNFDTP